MKNEWGISGQGEDIAVYAKEPILNPSTYNTYINSTEKKPASIKMNQRIGERNNWGIMIRLEGGNIGRNRKVEQRGKATFNHG